MTARHKVSKVVQYGKLYFFDSENIFESLRSLPTIKSQRPNKPAPLRSVPGSFPEIYFDLLWPSRWSPNPAWIGREVPHRVDNDHREDALHFILNSIFCTS